MTGGILFQDAGFLVVLNELALALSLLVILGAGVCNVPRKGFVEIGEVCTKCVSSLGGVDALSIEGILAKRTA